MTVAIKFILTVSMKSYKLG